MLVEVKPRRSDLLKKQQHKLLITFAKYGIDCFLWIPGEGFERITPTTLLPEIPKKGHSRKTLTREEKKARMSPEERAKIEEWERQGHTEWW